MWGGGGDYRLDFTWFYSIGKFATSICLLSLRIFRVLRRRRRSSGCRNIRRLSGLRETATGPFVGLFGSACGSNRCSCLAIQIVRSWRSYLGWERQMCWAPWDVPAPGFDWEETICGFPRREVFSTSMPSIESYRTLELDGRGVRNECAENDKRNQHVRETDQHVEKLSEWNNWNRSVITEQQTILFTDLKENHSIRMPPVYHVFACFCFGGLCTKSSRVCSKVILMKECRTHSCLISVASHRHNLWLVI